MIGKRRSPMCHKLLVDGRILSVYPRSKEKKWQRDKTVFKGICIKEAARAERKDFLKRVITLTPALS